MFLLKRDNKKIIIYKEKVLHSLNQLSKNYKYFLSVDKDKTKTSFIGKASEDLNGIIPFEYCKSDLSNHLFHNIETYYDINENEETYSKKPYFKEQISLMFTMGYGLIITDSDLLVLDIDTIYEHNELIQLVPDIIQRCKFKRINNNSEYRMHLYFKKPNDLKINGSIRMIKLIDEHMLVIGLNKFDNKFKSKKDISYLYRNEFYDYKLVGHMDDITECPSQIVNKIIQSQKL